MRTASQRPFTALIPAAGAYEAAVSWRLLGQTLLKRAVQKVSSVDRVQRVLVLADDVKGVQAEVRGMPKALPAAPGPLGDRCEGFQDMARDLPQLLAGFERDLRREVVHGGLVVANPLYPFLSAEEIERALDLFQQGQTGPRPWQPVRSFHEVPSHFHPRKILKRSPEGTLEHYDPKGREVYQRQQLEGDAYYGPSDALWVVDPSAPASPFPVEGGEAVTGLVLEGPVVRIEDRQTLGLAEAFCERDPWAVKGRI